MVVIVAALLSTVATVLKPLQDANEEMAKKSDILSSIGIETEDVEGRYAQVIKDEWVVRNGEIVESDVSPIDILMEMKKRTAMANTEREVPLFRAEHEGNTYYILPMQGKGLWGPIWGFVSLEADGNTVYGATYGHKSETPGLGAEIATPIFQDQYPGKILFSDSYDGIEVRKGDASGDQQVDGISGGTITSVAVQYMFEDCLVPYKGFLMNLSQVEETPAEDVAVEEAPQVEDVENTNAQ